MAITSANQLELLQTAEAVAREKMIDPNLVVEAMEESLARAAKSRYGAEMDIRVAIDRKTGRATFTRVRTVVEDEELENYQAEFTVEQAKQYMDAPEVGQRFVEEVPPVEMGRIAAQSAKQVILQKVREAERDRQFEEFKDRVGEIINGTVKRVEYGNVIVDLGRGEAIIRRDELIPRDHVENVRRLGREIDATLASFIRGQGTVMLILGLYYAIALMLVGLQFGLVVGLIAGMLTFIPYVGSVIGGVLSIGLALFQFWGMPVWIVVVAVIFVIGQTVEGNFLTPKLVGRSVGLHPVWLMFALSAFGSFMGFTGMLIAVPVAATLGVFFRFGVGQYLDGRLYQGLSARDAGNPDG